MSSSDHDSREKCVTDLETKSVTSMRRSTVFSLIGEPVAVCERCRLADRSSREVERVKRTKDQG